MEDARLALSRRWFTTINSGCVGHVTLGPHRIVMVLRQRRMFISIGRRRVCGYS